MERVIDVAPRPRWDLDLTTAEGADQILAIFQEVKNVILDEGTQYAYALRSAWSLF
jgi:hypothetical protein